MQDYGLVSIITPSYNSEAYIEETIESILAQTYTNWELLITDDCSTDHSTDIVKRYCQQDNRIKLIQLSKNSGAGICRNISIEAAQGRFIAFCDSDDCWTPDKLEKQIKFMIERNIAFSYGSYMLCNEDGDEIGINICLKKVTYKRIIMDNFVGCLTAVYDIEKLGKMYMPIIRKRQDWGLWISILRKCKVAYGIKQPIGYYRIRSNSVSSDKWALVKYHAMLYNQILHIPMFLSFCMYLFVNLPTYIIKTFRVKIINF